MDFHFLSFYHNFNTFFTYFYRFVIKKIPSSACRKYLYIFSKKSIAK